VFFMCFLTFAKAR